MKKLIVIAMLLITLIITGCSYNKNMQIKCEELSEEQNEMLTLTGNRVFKYKLKNLPNDKKYNINLVYEVYKDGEKIKDESIAGMGYCPTKEKIDDLDLAINIQDNNKIRCIAGPGYTTFDIEEDISKLTQYSMGTDFNINIGDEVYLFHASNGGLTSSNLGLLSKEDKDSYIKENEMNVFIKLAFEEIQI